MALYTLKNRNEVINSLANYNGDNAWVRNQLASSGYMPSAASTQMYDAIGRDAGSTGSNNGNFIQKRASSIGNAIGTTLSAPISIAHDIGENIATQKFLSDSKSRMNDIAKKYGYNTWSDWLDGYAAANDSGDTARIAEMSKQLEEFKAQANANVAEATARAQGYDDYRKNNLISQNINQDRGKFAGSAINTLSTGFDVLSMAAGIPNGALINAGQGAIEGVADELEQNGFQNFDWGRAGMNAATGAAAGAATGALNSSLSGKLANGGKIFDSNNILARGANKIAQSSIGRGALSGALGGAVGAGTASALSGQDIGTGLQNALSGAGQGAVQGAIAGGVMGAASKLGNAALNKFAPNAAQALQENQARNASYGDTMREQLKGAWNSGDSGTAEFLKTVPERFSDVVDNVKEHSIGLGIKNVSPAQNVNTKAYWEQEMKALDAEGVPFTSPRYQAAMDEWKKAPDTLSYGSKEVNAAVNKFLDTLTPEGQIPTEGFAYGENASARREAIAALRNELTDLELADLMVSERNPKIKSLLADAGGQNVNEYDIKFRDARGNVARLPELKSQLNPDNQTVIANSDLIDSPMRGRMYDNMSDADFIEYAKKNGWYLANTTGGTKTNYGPSTPETEVYRTLTGETETTNPDLMYGESALGNRTRRGMVADSLERFGNTLEGAQTNVTRAAAKDLGIESTGKVVENVRKKTGIVNLETQAELAKELTGGADSLMDSVQRNALTASENGQPYKVDTTDVANNVESVVDKYADTNMFGSQKAKDRFISNLRRDITDYDSDVLTIANRMKSNAADLRGKGVASPTPADSAKAKIYTEIANQLDDLSYKAIPQDNVDAMFETTISEMRGRAQQSQNTGNTDIAKAYTKLADSLEAEPRTIKAYRSFKKDFVDTAKIAELTARAENGAAVQMGRSLGGSLKRFGNTLLQRPINTGLAKAGGAINSLAEKIGADNNITPNTTAQAITPSTQIYNALGREIGLQEGEKSAGNYINKAAGSTGTVTLEGMASTPASTNATSVYNSLYGNNTTATTTANNYYTNLLERAMQMAMDDGNAAAFATLYSMYNENTQNQGKDYSNLANWSSSDRTKLLSAQNALDQIDELEAAYNQATGGEGSNVFQGTLRSIGANISGGNLDASAANYNTLADSVGMAIVKNLINLGVTEADAERYRKYLPSLTDTKQQATSKLATLRSIYQNQINNLKSAYGL